MRRFLAALIAGGGLLLGCQPAAPAGSAVGTLSGTGAHFCTASVVASPAHDLIVSAAHCMSNGLVFAPGYGANGATYGQWTVTKVFVDPRWTASHDPDVDVAFATVAPRNGKNVQDVVAANVLSRNAGYVHQDTLTGFVNGHSTPATCTGTSSRFTATQLRIACPGMSEGTSGGPWISGGEVVGIIGGYQLGGNTPDVSYSPYLGNDVYALYQRAVS